MAIVEQKHAQWQQHLRSMLAQSRCEATSYLLWPATYLDSVATAIHLTRLQPNQLLVMPRPLRKLVSRFQRRARQLGVAEVLPKIAHARHVRRMHDPRARQRGPPSAGYWQ